jgi:hypothetical protein
MMAPGVHRSDRPPRSHGSTSSRSRFGFWVPAASEGATRC